MIASDGYVRFSFRNYEKFYRAQLTDGRNTRILRTKFRTAAEAIEYGLRVAARFNRVHLAIVPAEV